MTGHRMNIDFGMLNYVRKVIIPPEFILDYNDFEEPSKQ
jgi:hypothetical protein